MFETEVIGNYHHGSGRVLKNHIIQWYVENESYFRTEIVLLYRMFLKQIEITRLYVLVIYLCENKFIIDHIDLYRHDSSCESDHVLPTLLFLCIAV